MDDGVTPEEEFGRYLSDPHFIRHMISLLGTDRGESLEVLAHHIVSLIPGARVYRRQRTLSTDFDVVGSSKG